MGLYGSAWLARCPSPLEQDLSRVPGADALRAGRRGGARERAREGSEED